MDASRVAARHLRATDIPWGIEDRWPWFNLVQWPPDRAHLREVERIIGGDPDAFSVIGSGQMVSVDLRGQVDESSVIFRADGRMDVYLPMLTEACPAIRAKVIRGLQVRHSVLTPSGHLTTRSDEVVLPTVMAGLRRWLADHGSALRTQRGRGVYRRSGVYLRFGRWGSSSKVFLDGERLEDDVDPGFDRKYEAGISVYAAKPLAAGGYALVSPDPRKAIYGTGSGYMTDMLRKMRGRIEAGEVYLVAGNRVRLGDSFAYGADGEPLLEPAGLRVLADLTPAEVFWQGRSLSEILGL